MIDLDDVAALRAADPGGMLDAIVSLPEQCREGFELGRSADGLPTANGVTSLAFCGMGGSGIAGDVIAAVLTGRLGVPVSVVRSPELPAHCGADTLVIVSSYSGSTAETRSLFDRALERGCRLVVVTSGGALAERAADAGVALLRVPERFAMPRAAFGYLALVPLGALEAIGMAAGLAREVDRAASTMVRLRDICGPEAPTSANPAKTLASRIAERVPVIWGEEGVAAVAAARWKTQFNENAKVPAFSSALPELDHNEVVGWSEDRGRGFFLVVLRHPHEHPDVASRFAPSEDIARSSGADVHEVWAGDGPLLATLLEHVMVGDFVTAYHALARGIDPSPIDAIVRLKRSLDETTARRTR